MSNKTISGSRMRRLFPHLESSLNALTAEEQAAQNVEKIRGSFSKFTTSLNKLNLPEALKPAVKSLEDEVNGLLASMPALDAHRAATDATYALNSLTGAISHCQDCLDRAMNTISTMSQNCTSALNAKDASLNGLIDAAVTKQKTDGVLFDKAAVDGMVATAREQGKTLALNSVAAIAKRRGEIEKLKLPQPENEALLEGDDAAFTKLTTTAADRVKILTGKGIALNSKTEGLVKGLIYSEAFDAQLAIITEALKVAGTGEGSGGGGGGNSGGKRLVF